MPVHDAHWIGAHIAVDGDAEHEIVGLEVKCRRRRNQAGVGEGGNAILDDATPGDLLEPDLVLDVPGKKDLEIGVDQVVNASL